MTNPTPFPPVGRGLRGRLHLKKFLIAGAASVLALVGLVTIAQAAPGPNGKNNHGMCTAYFNGQKKGWDKNGTPGPFAALQSTAESSESNKSDTESSNEIAEDVFEYCDNGTNIGGNPSQNGRFANCYSTDASDSVTFNCPDS